MPQTAEHPIPELLQPIRPHQTCGTGSALSGLSLREMKPQVSAHMAKGCR